MNRIKVITSDNYADKRGLIWTSWKKNNLNLNEGAHFDFIQALSRQNLCKANIQLYCMIKNNLKPKIIEAYPINTNFVRIILGYYEKSISNYYLFYNRVNVLCANKYL